VDGCHYYAPYELLFLRAGGRRRSSLSSLSTVAPITEPLKRKREDRAIRTVKQLATTPVGVTHGAARPILKSAKTASRRRRFATATCRS
jgi:hypothetical protein